MVLVEWKLKLNQMGSGALRTYDSEQLRASPLYLNVLTVANCHPIIKTLWTDHHLRRAHTLLVMSFTRRARLGAFVGEKKGEKMEMLLTAFLILT